MDSTKLASYVAGCDDSHNDPSPSHERDDTGERHQRLVLIRLALEKVAFTFSLSQSAALASIR
ncbi:hypothetical protein GmHk_18G052122 [Glycine max]|nr:hypothetical protein GmHk_18G052122 [Glycine max]